MTIDKRNQVDSEKGSNKLRSLGEILSPVPACGSDQDRYRRITGRFGYQMLSDVISFSQNLPQRLLLLEQLEGLPRLLHELLNEPDMQRILRRELANDKKAVDQILAMGEPELQARIEGSAKVVLQLAEDAWQITLGQESSTHSYDRTPNDTYDRAWWKLLLISLPHIERQIWLTEMSAPLPIHAITRFHDIWSAFILLWCYTNREEFSPKQGAVEKLVSRPAFGTDACMHLSIINGWDLPSWNNPGRQQITDCDRKPDSHQVMIVVGPYFLAGQDGNKNKYADFFRLYMELATRNVSGWSDRNTATPQREELLELVMSRLSISVAELDLRLRSIINSWKQVRALLLDPNMSLNRDDWEYVASASGWLARWQSVLASPDVQTTAVKHGVAKLAISFPGWDDKMVEALLPSPSSRAENRSFDPVMAVLTRRLKTEIEPTAIFLEYTKRSSEYRGLDMPNVNLNRMRERQAANWSVQIMGINNLMNRHTHGASSVSSIADNGNEKAANLLRGAGGRLCQHLLSITHAHNVNIYWMDYSRFPAKLEFIEGYSRLLTHRAQRADIVAAFDRRTYVETDRTSSCHMRRRAKSQIYRVAALNEAEVLDDESNAIWDGFLPPLIPKSALALPIRQNGKVVGVIELNGLVRDQFSQRLLSPLLTAANLIGPFLYHNLHLRQLAKINRWVTQTDPLRLEDAHNPLEDVAKHLTNIFLCPMVHIWLCRQDSEIYELWGYNLTEPFDKYMTKTGSRPWFRVTTTDQTTYCADTPFSRLAVDIWRADTSAEYPWGQFCKGRFYDEEKSTILDLNSARTAGLQLFQDFVDTEDKDRGYRRIIFRDLGLHDLAAFHLAQIDPVENSTVRTESGQQAEPSTPLGVVLLHDFGDSGAQERGELISQFGAGWEPTVEYLQQYLPTLLEQVAMFHSSVQQARRLLLHQARHELAEVERRLPKLLGQLHYVFEGEGRDVLRRVVQLGDSSSSGGQMLLPKSAWDGIKRLQDAVMATDNSRLYLDTERFAARIGRLAGKLKSVRGYNTLSVDPGEACQTIDLWTYIRDELTNRRTENIGAGRDPKPTGFRRDKMYSVWVVKTAWDRLMINLFSNMQKYSVVHRDWKIDLDGYILTLENIGVTHPDDNAKELKKPSRRGRLATSEEGQGLGLTDADLAATLLGIKLQYEIRLLPATQGIPTRVAYHTYRLNLKNVLTIKHVG
jgi:hypothetical protein